LYCYLNEQIVIASLSFTPPYLYNLLIINDPDTDEPYINQIRAYNQVLAFTFLGTNIDENLVNAKDGVYTFRIQSVLYHQIGNLILKDEDQKPSFA
jgi:hypothetical protein